MVLVKIISESSIDESTKQSAAILLKKMTRENWTRDKEDDSNLFIIPDDTKQLIKENIIELLIHSPERVR